jgi:hypothetical protein
MRIIHAIATLLTALTLVPGGAHLFEMPNKLGLDSEQYFIVQQIYRGWALFGFVIIAAFVANATLALLQWKRRESFGHFSRFVQQRSLGATAKLKGCRRAPTIEAARYHTTQA